MNFSKSQQNKCENKDKENNDTWVVAYTNTYYEYILTCIYTLRQNGRHFTDDSFKTIFLNEIVSILITISLKFIPKGPINNIPLLFQIMAWCRPSDKL